VEKLFENWKKFLKEEEQRVVTFDFDDTLSLSHWGEEEDNWVHDGPHKMMVEKIKNFIADPSVAVYVVTSRFEENEPQAHKNPDQKAVKEFLGEMGISVKDIFFTNGQPKIETLLKLDSTLHHDDDPEDIRDAKENGIEAIVSDPYGDYEKLKTGVEKMENEVE